MRSELRAVVVAAYGVLRAGLRVLRCAVAGHSWQRVAWRRVYCDPAYPVHGVRAIHSKYRCLNCGAAREYEVPL